MHSTRYVRTSTYSVRHPKSGKGGGILYLREVFLYVFILKYCTGRKGLRMHRSPTFFDFKLRRYCIHFSDIAPPSATTMKLAATTFSTITLFLLRQVSAFGVGPTIPFGVKVCTAAQKHVGPFIDVGIVDSLISFWFAIPLLITSLAASLCTIFSSIHGE